MVIDLILIGLSLIALLIASYTDIKTREVPDILSYILVIGSLCLRFMASIITNDWAILLSGLAGFLLFVVLGYLMYNTGQWGGGDSKLLMGMGAAIGLDFHIVPFPTLLLFLLNLVIAGAVYGTLWIIVLGIKHSKAVKDQIKTREQQTKKIHQTLIIATLPLVILSVVAIQDNILRISLGGLAIIPLVSYYLWIIVKSIEVVAFYKHISPNKLTEGDWIANDIIVEKQYITGPKENGITPSQIRKLIALYKRGKIKTILVKEGIPFVPSFLIGFVITMAIGDWTRFFLL